MDELQSLVAAHSFYLNRFRTNLGPSAPSVYAGKRMLLAPVLSNSVHGAGRTKKQARMLELVRSLLPDVKEPLMLTLNKNVCCGKHKDNKNASGIFLHHVFWGL